MNLEQLVKANSLWKTLIYWITLFTTSSFLFLSCLMNLVTNSWRKAIKEDACVLRAGTLCFWGCFYITYINELCQTLPYHLPSHRLKVCSVTNYLNCVKVKVCKSFLDWFYFIYWRDLAGLRQDLLNQT